MGHWTHYGKDEIVRWAIVERVNVERTHDVDSLASKIRICQE